ncbi:MAG: hypothetical protein C4560_02940 [Nitrospiraceae bacterium]|nr:MAG: hypothetical protein C4560_02940 [Nitrospiraceae bacterium]
MTLGEIERQTTEYAIAKRELDELVAEISERTEALKREFTPKLKSVMGKIARKHETLYRSIADNTDLFEKPRTQIFEGIKVGLMKGKGKLFVEDEELTIKLIKKHMPEQEEYLIHTKYELIKSAIKKLTDKEQDKINVAIIDKDDRIVIESIDTTVQKILNSLIKVQIEGLSEEYKEEAA